MREEDFEHKEKIPAFDFEHVRFVLFVCYT